jgi:predicted ester cyclase
MTREDLRITADNYVKAWQRRDPVAIGQHHALDGVVESPIYSTLHGRKAIEDSARAFFTSFPDARFTLDALMVDVPRVALFATLDGNHVNEFLGMPGTNRHLELRTAWLLEMNDDLLIAFRRTIYDFTGLLMQVGILRAKPAKP